MTRSERDVPRAGRPVPGTRFDRTTVAVLEPGERTTGTIELDPGWASLRGVHGGYLAAVAVRFAEAHLPGRRVRTVATTFLRPGTIGPATLSIDTLRVSRSLTTHEVTVAQDSRPIARTRVTATTESGAPPLDGRGVVLPVAHGAGLDVPVADEGGVGVPLAEGGGWSDAEMPRLAQLDACAPLVPPPGIRHFEQAVAVLDPADLPFANGPRARVRGYVRPLEPRPIDAAWLAMILDWFPPSPFSRHDGPVGGVSIDFTAHIHRTLPELGDGWLVGTFDAGVGHDGLAVEHGTIFGPHGAALAESFHTRWTR